MTEARYRILDLDNCISDDGWRIPRIDWGLPPGNARYAEYHKLCGFDKCVNRELFERALCPKHVGYEHQNAVACMVCTEVLKLREEGEPLNVILTGRPTSVRGITEEWLARNRVPYKFLLMRNNPDERRSVAIKEQHLDWLASWYEISITQIVEAFDDHPEIVAMYNATGIPAKQVKAHSENAYINPHTKEAVL